jgi:hypothetical protein
MTLNGKAYPRAERGLEDAGAAPERGKPCCKRLPHGGHCVLADKHAGDCDGPPLRYEHPQRLVDHKVLAKPQVPRAPAPPAAEVVWPKPGEKFQDSGGRILTITEIDPKSPIERHLMGTLDDGIGYACSRMVFDQTWRAIV